jgi:hypothetical protein
MLATIPGLSYLCWLSMRKEHSEITLEKLTEQLQVQENVDIVNFTFRKVNNLPDQPLKKVRRAKQKKR